MGQTTLSDMMTEILDNVCVNPNSEPGKAFYHVSVCDVDFEIVAEKKDGVWVIYSYTAS